VVSVENRMLSMKKHEIEAWALRIIDQVQTKKPNEDSRVELKADWPTDTNKAARRIGGHANAAGGELILWLIGVDQALGVTGASDNETAEWLAKVRSNFDGLMPSLSSDLVIPVRGKTVVALLFETDRAPFVVKNPVFGQPQGGPVQREVPWREGTAVRSATRDELLRLLVPLARLPTVEVLGAALRVTDLHGLRPAAIGWSLDLYLYITPEDERRVVIAAHACELFALQEGGAERITFGPVTFGCGSALNTATRTELILTSPGLVTVTASCQTPPPLRSVEGNVRVGGRLQPLRRTLPSPSMLNLPRNMTLGTWRNGSGAARTAGS
jgi:hypothetical protein